MDGETPALVFVHGGVHTGSCWDATIAAIGCRDPRIKSLAVDLPGRRGVAGDLASLSIDGCVRSVSEQILARIGPGGGTDRVVLVGHSLAGVLIPRIVGWLGPSRVQRVVFVACCVPPTGKCVIDTLRFPLNRITRWVIQRSPVISRIPPGVVRFFFANGATAEQREAIRSNLCAESSALLTDVPAIALPPSVPRNWILPTRDRALRPAVQRAFVDGLGGVDRVVSIEAGHEVLITHPDELAAEIIELAFPELPSS
jgi:pimeloyl-ACP methyl ester carboxylesterase